MSGIRGGLQIMAESVSGVFVPVEVLAREQNTTAEEVVERIQNGALIGRKQSDGWHVMVRAPAAASTPAPAAAPAPGPGAAPGAPRPSPPPSEPEYDDRIVELAGPVRIDGITEVVVRDVQIRFSAMVVLLLKFVLACVPVGLILGGVAFGGLWLYQKFGTQIMERVMPLIGG